VGGGAKLRMENIFGNSDTTSDTDILRAMRNCVTSLDDLKRSSGLPYRMVVSMSLGGEGYIYSTDKYMNDTYSRCAARAAAASTHPACLPARLPHARAAAYRAAQGGAACRGTPRARAGLPRALPPHG
jgi:hypothetical protein